MNSNIGIGTYFREDYQEILNLSDDRENMHQTWKEWKTSKIDAVKNFKTMGIQTIDIIVKPIELVNYSREKGVKINGETRANFVSFKVEELNKK